MGAWGYRERAWLDAALLIVTELTANAVRHTEGDVMSVQVRAVDGRVRVAVVDGSATLPRRLAPQHDENGRGLMIVAALAAKWSADLLVSGKRVWAELVPYPAPEPTG